MYVYKGIWNSGRKNNVVRESLGKEDVVFPASAIKYSLGFWTVQKMFLHNLCFMS